MAVGGIKKDEDTHTNEIYTYDEQLKIWKQTIPPMPTARFATSVLSLPSTLVVAGGVFSPRPNKYTNAVEIYKSDTTQWYRTVPLSIACGFSSSTLIGNACYVFGGYNGSDLHQTVYASVDDLVANALPADQTSSSDRGDTQSTWKLFTNTPMYNPAAAVIAGNLLAIGGRETPTGGPSTTKIHMYSPSTNSWIYISDLPAPRSETTAAVLSSTEILVIGGNEGYGKLNSVYKGTLHLKL